MHLAPYDAQNLCAPCEALETDAYVIDDEGIEFKVVSGK